MIQSVLAGDAAHAPALLVYDEIERSAKERCRAHQAVCKPARVGDIGVFKLAIQRVSQRPQAKKAQVFLTGSVGLAFVCAAGVNHGARQQNVVLVASERLRHHLVVVLHHLVQRDAKQRAHKHKALYIRRGGTAFPVADGVAGHPDGIGKVRLRHAKLLASAPDLLGENHCRPFPPAVRSRSRASYPHACTPKNP